MVIFENIIVNHQGRAYEYASYNFYNIYKPQKITSIFTEILMNTMLFIAYVVNTKFFIHVCLPVF